MSKLYSMMQAELNAYDPGKSTQQGIEVKDIPGFRGMPSMFNKYSVFGPARANLLSETGNFDARLLFDKAVVAPESAAPLPTNTFKSQDPEFYASQLELKQQALAELKNKIKDNPSDKAAIEQQARAVDAEIRDLEEELQSLGMNNRINGLKDSAYANAEIPTAETIIKFSQNQTIENSLYGPMPYSWSDFLFCKWYGRIPNNYLITLRRYSLPVYDNATVTNGDAIPPVAQACTFIGEDPGNKLSEVMKFTYGLVWKEIEAKVQDVEGNEVGFGAGVESLGLGARSIERVGGALAMMRGDWSRWSGQLEKQNEWARGAFGSEGPYWNQVLGPVNVVHKTYMRDMGMKFQQDIKLVFEYDLSSYNGVNPRMALIDLMTNMLSLTYNNAKFWGGAMRYFPNARPAVTFLGNQDSFYNGDWDNYFSSVGEELTGMFSKIADGLKALFSGSLNIKEIAQNLAGGISNMVLGKLARKSRPHILSIRNMLSGDPIGEWHLTVGNPLNPIAVMGNLIVDDVEFSMGDKLGADDFPTEVKFTVTLKHGRPRDKGDIESIFNLGNGRLSYSPITKLPSETGTFGDNYKDFITQKDRQKELEGTNGSNIDHESSGILGESRRNFVRIANRIQDEWGPAYVNSNLAWIFDKTQLEF